MTLATASVFLMSGCQDSRDQPTVTSWGTVDGHPVHLYTLDNANGMTAVISDYGGTVVSLTAPDRSGHFADVVLGYNTIEEYTQPGHSPYFGAIVGRYGNRIANGPLHPRRSELHPGHQQQSAGCPAACMAA
jgi:hypothetical protein